MQSNKIKKYQPNKEYMAIYQWYYNNIWKDKTKFAPVQFKRFYHFINKIKNKRIDIEKIKEYKQNYKN